MVKSVGLYRSGRGRSPVGKIVAWNLWRAQARFRRRSCSHHAAERTRCGVGVLRQLRHDRVADVKRHGVGQHRYAVAVDRRQQLRDGVGERALPVDPSLAPFLRTSQAVSRPFVPRFFSFFARFHRLDEAVPTSPKPKPRAKKEPAMGPRGENSPLRSTPQVQWEGSPGCCRARQRARRRAAAGGSCARRGSPRRRAARRAARGAAAGRGCRG